MAIDRASDNPFPSILMVEGDPEDLAANPAAGQRRLAVGADHVLYLVDDAGVATLVGAAPPEILDIPTAETDDTLVLAPDGAGGVEFRAETGGGGLPSGASFPGSPSTNDVFFRTDRGLIYFYDGTRWLTATVFVEQGVLRSGGGVTGDIDSQITASANSPRSLSPSLLGGSDVWLVDYRVVFTVGSGFSALSASHKWVATPTAFSLTPASLGVVVTLSVDSGSSGVWRSATTPIGALQPAGTIFYQTSWTKTGTPGALIAGEQLSYRLVG